MTTATAIALLILAAPASYLGARLGRAGVDCQLRQMRRPPRAWLVRR